MATLRDQYPHAEVFNLAPLQTTPFNFEMRHPNSRNCILPERDYIEYRMQCLSVGLLASLCTAHIAWAKVDFTPFTSEATTRGVNYLVASYGTGPGFLGSGLCAADLDGDGNTDIVAMGKASGIISVFRNVGGGMFAAQTSSIAPLSVGSSVAAGDFDSDGDLDLVFSQMGGPPRLYRQDAPFIFSDITTQAGLTGAHAGRTIAWFDANGDGRLDILMACYTGYLLELPSSTTRIWRNEGDGTFTDITISSGLGVPMKTFVVTPFDFDHDGDADLYFSNDRGFYAPTFMGNRLYRNDGGFFTDISENCGASPGYDSMGVAVGDLDENGWMDLMTTNLATKNQPLSAIHPLFLAVGVGIFQESSVAWGIVPQIANETGWAVHQFDVDNDGMLDVFLNNQFTPDRLFRQDLPGHTIEMAEAANLLGSSGVSFCSVVSDFDNDGGLDILSNHAGGNLRMMMNQEAAERSWLELQIRGEGLNRDAIGARLVVHANGRSMIRQVFAGGTGYLGMNDPRIHVGCANAVTASVQVWWPNSSSTRVLTNLPTSKRWTIYPPSALGDGNFNGEADESDLILFDQCAAQSGLTVGCEMFDFDGNSVLDAADRSALQIRINRDAADVNNDGHVNGGDLAILLGGWGSNSIGDINHSGLVDAVDLAMLLAAWG